MLTKYINKSVKNTRYLYTNEYEAKIDTTERNTELDKNMRQNGEYDEAQYQHETQEEPRMEKYVQPIIFFVIRRAVITILCRRFTGL